MSLNLGESAEWPNPKMSRRISGVIGISRQIRLLFKEEWR